MTKAEQAKAGKGKAAAKGKKGASASGASSPNGPASDDDRNPDNAAATVSAARPGPPEKASGGMGGFMVLALLAVLGVGGYASWPYWSQAVLPYLSDEKAGTSNGKPETQPSQATDISTGQLAEERRQLHESLTRLMARMEKIEKAVENVKKLAEATTPPSEKEADVAVLKELSGRVDAIEQNGADMKSLLQRMDRMEQDAAALSKSSAQASAKDAGASESVVARALVLAVANLRQALAGSDSYAPELDALKAMAGDNTAINASIAVLSKHAAEGLPTLPVLKQEFAAIAGKIVHASKVAKKTGWLSRVGDRLSSLVTWRRIDGKGEASSIDAMVAAAESRLQAEDLKAAIQAVEGLSVNAKAAAVAAPWLSIAKARMDADRAVASLHIHAISLLTPVDAAKG